MAPGLFIPMIPGYPVGTSIIPGGVCHPLLMVDGDERTAGPGVGQLAVASDSKDDGVEDRVPLSDP